MEKLRVFEAFCGYGSQALALERLAEDFPEFSFEVVGVSDIDPYPLQAYQALHGHCPNYGDISKIDWDKVPDFDLFTYSFPCVDISGAGQQQGFAEGSGTRSSLLWECRKAILAKKPKYLLMENVKALVSKKFMPLYQTWLDWLEAVGYKSKWAIMNAKDFGVAQNRERVFVGVALMTRASIRLNSPSRLSWKRDSLIILRKMWMRNISYQMRPSSISNECMTMKVTDTSLYRGGGDDTAFTIRTKPGSRVDDNFVYDE